MIVIFPNSKSIVRWRWNPPLPSRSNGESRSCLLVMPAIISQGGGFKRPELSERPDHIAIPFESWNMLSFLRLDGSFPRTFFAGDEVSVQQQNFSKPSERINFLLALSGRMSDTVCSSGFFSSLPLHLAPNGLVVSPSL